MLARDHFGFTQPHAKLAATISRIKLTWQREMVSYLTVSHVQLTWQREMASHSTVSHIQLTWQKENGAAYKITLHI